MSDRGCDGIGIIDTVGHDPDVTMMGHGVEVPNRAEAGGNVFGPVDRSNIDQEIVALFIPEPLEHGDGVGNGNVYGGMIQRLASVGGGKLGLESDDRVVSSGLRHGQLKRKRSGGEVAEGGCFLHLVLEFDERIKQRLGPRRATADVDVDRNDAIHAL